MVHYYKKSHPEKTTAPHHSHQETAPPVANNLPLPVSNVLQLQRLIGNTATQRLLIQRMPTANQVIGVLGKPKKNFGLIKKSTKYRAVLDALSAYHKYIGDTKLGADKGAWKTQFTQIMTLLGDVDTAISAYDGLEGNKAAYMKTLKAEVQQERHMASETLLQLVTDPPKYNGAPSLLTVMMNQSKRIKPFHFDKGDIVDTDKGGTNEVQHVVKGGYEGYFKENKTRYYDYHNNQEDDQKRAFHDAQSRNSALKPEEREHHRYMREKIINESSVSGDAQIDKLDAHSANRDIAMSRLDQLLGAGVIARAQFAVRHLPDGSTVMGSLMEKAKGQALDARTDDTILGGPTGVSMEDPNLMRFLSRLQLLDLLAGQVDRNIGNIYVETDKQGNVIGVTGIDNEMGFGELTDIEHSVRELPGISRYMDREVAERILALDADLLRLIMMDLLSPREIDALITRLNKLKAVIGPLAQKGQLLDPDQWTKAMAKGLLDENKNYYGDFNRKKNMRMAHLRSVGKL